MEYYMAIKRGKCYPCILVWVDLENIMLSEISQSEKDKLTYDFTHMWNLMNKLN